MRRVAAIILAAGGSTRLGTPKQLLEFQGKTLLRRAAECALGAGCVPVIAVLGHQFELMRAELAGLPVEAKLNAGWERGIGSSIRQGIEQLQAAHPGVEACILLLCDQPLVDAGVMNALMHAHERSGKPVCVCSYENTIGPPVLVTSALFPELLALPDSQGAKAIWVNKPELVETVPCPHAALDIDTADDVLRLRSVSPL